MNVTLFGCKITVTLCVSIIDIGGGEGPTAEEKEKLQQLEQERLDDLREAEERRKEKHRKMEEERESMRQGIRDKVRTFFHD